MMLISKCLLFTVHLLVHLVRVCMHTLVMVYTVYLLLVILCTFNSLYLYLGVSLVTFMAYALCISLCELTDALHSSVMFTLPILLFSGGYVSLFGTEYDCTILLVSITLLDFSMNHRQLDAGISTVIHTHLSYPFLFHILHTSDFHSLVLYISFCAYPTTPQIIWDCDIAMHHIISTVK